MSKSAPRAAVKRDASRRRPNHARAVFDDAGLHFRHRIQTIAGSFAKPRRHRLTATHLGGIAMDWISGYPEPFRFLDEEHAEIGAMVTALKNASGADGEKNPALLSRRLFRKIVEHASHEEALMKKYDYPERELHAKYHEHINHSIELILQLFNRKGVAEHGAAIAKHIGNKMSEEMFVDRLFAEFLAQRCIRE